MRVLRRASFARTLVSVTLILYFVILMFPQLAVAQATCRLHRRLPAAANDEQGRDAGRTRLVESVGGDLRTEGYDH